jgi:biotin synthase
MRPQRLPSSSTASPSSICFIRPIAKHREHHNTQDIQKCFLHSVKTGGCPEDCGYCSQSAHHQTALVRQKLVTVEEAVAFAENAKQAGAHRFCMGAAWRHAPDGEQFDRVLEMICAVKALGLETCVTLGMLNASQAERLKKAGLDAYNHNLDTSREHYPNIVTTRTYDDRLETLRLARGAGLALCCGGILGMGDNETDRCALITEIASLDPQPESVPINLLVPIQGTPLFDSLPVSSFDLVRTVAVARILIPGARIRLAAGRMQLSKEAQALAFFAGANSIFIGTKLLTTPNAEASVDDLLFTALDTQDGAKLGDAPQANVDGAYS